MSNLVRRTHKRESMLGRVLGGAAALAGVVLFFRALPDLVRYMRIRRM